VLAAGSEVEVLTVLDRAGSAAVNLTGNEFAQTMIGNAGANLLNGGAGADLMYGLGGNDGYIADAGDQVFEFAGQGQDTVFATGSFVLAAGSEVEALSVLDRTSAAAVNLTGNELAQTLIGNAGANLLDGGAGNDILYGLGGDDGYIVNLGDEVLEFAGQGQDTVYATGGFVLAAGSEVEVLTVLDRAGSAAADLTGNGFGQTLIGNNGANRLDGGAGGDALYGLGGADTFVFSTAFGATNVDVIGDFASGTDKIALDDAVFTGLGLGNLAAGAFVIGTAAQDADDRILYNPATGALYFDADGNGAGAAIQFAALIGAPAINAGDFILV